MSPTDTDNGRRLPVRTSFFTGPAGVLVGDAGGQFAAIVSTPIGEWRGQGADIDGRAATIISVRPSATTAGMTVARFVWAQEKN